MKTKVEHRNPWTFVPSLAFTLGVAMIVVQQVNVIIFKSLGMSNDKIGMLTLLALPVAFNVLIAPVVDSRGTKRQWLLITQLFMVGCFAILALVMLAGVHVIPFSLAALIVLAVSFGIYCVPNGGFYVEALTKKEQGLFVGINTASIRVAIIFVTGILVIISGKFGEMTGKVEYGWSLFFALCGAIVLLTTVWHHFILPYPPKKEDEEKPGYFVVFKAFFAQKAAWLIVVFILLYRLGEGLLARMADPFFLDGADVGGLGMTVADVGFARGTMGVIASIVGGILAGLFLKSKHYKKMILILALCMTAPNTLYIYLAHFQPTTLTAVDFSFIPKLFGSDAVWALSLNMKAQVAILIESFGYGMGYAAFLFVVYRLASESKYRATTISFCMALQNIGWTFSGVLSGFLQTNLGYTWLFILSIVLSLPGFLLLVSILKAREL